MGTPTPFSCCKLGAFIKLDLKTATAIFAWREPKSQFTTYDMGTPTPF